MVKQYPNAEVLPRSPGKFDEMIRLANVLSHGIGYVRVDLYNVKGGIYFGEMTFTDELGVGMFTLEKFDRFFGDIIDLPTNRG